MDIGGRCGRGRSLRTLKPISERLWGVVGGREERRGSSLPSLFPPIIYQIAFYQPAFISQNHTYHSVLPINKEIAVFYYDALGQNKSSQLLSMLDISAELCNHVVGK